MQNHKLWQTLAELKSDYNWVELSHDLSPQTPHWIGWEPLAIEEKANLNSSLFNAAAYTVVGQYGTHVDAPIHMIEGGRTLDQISLKEMVYPLCVIDKSEAVKTDDNYILTVQDVMEWEAENGKIPEGAFVAFRSDWSKRDPKTFDNFDANGRRNFPGWGLETLEFLVKERGIGAIGHEPSDTESPVTSDVSSYAVEYYILEQDRIQIELLKNLDKCPATGAVIFCTFPKLKDGSGYPARCFALCPKK